MKTNARFLFAAALCAVPLLAACSRQTADSPASAVETSVKNDAVISADEEVCKYCGGIHSAEKTFAAELSPEWESCPSCGSTHLSIVNQADITMSAFEDCIHKAAGVDHWYDTYVQWQEMCLECGEYSEVRLTFANRALRECEGAWSE